MCFWVPWDCNNLTDSSWKTFTNKALHRQLTETFPVFLTKRPTYLSRSIDLRVWQTFSLAYLQRPTEGALREWEPVNAISPYASLQLTGILQKGVYTLVLCPEFCGCFQETPSHCLALVASRASICRSQGTVLNGERALKKIPSPGQSKRQET